MAYPQSIQVLLADPFRVIHAGVAAFLRVAPDLHLMGVTTTGLQTLTWCKLYQPDVLLLEPLLFGSEGLSTLCAIRDHCPSIQVLIFSESALPALVQTALEVGVAGYLLKNIGAQELVDAIRAAAQGSVVLNPSVSEVVLNQLERESLLARLTLREREVLAYLVRGASNEEIAAHLIVTRSTVKAHLHHIFAKLGVRNRVQAVALALQEPGFIGSEPNGGKPSTSKKMP